jgi:hypothetical protein
MRGVLKSPRYSKRPRAANIVVDGYDERGKPVKIEMIRSGDSFANGNSYRTVPKELTITVISTIISK